MPRILVIDDDAGIRTVIKQILESAGFAVTLAANGKLGVEAFQQSPHDAVITDIIMPEKEGIGTIEALRQLDPKVPIVAISGGGRTANLDFLPIALSRGATKAVAKPFKRTELLEALGQALASGGRSGAKPAGSSS